MTRKLLVLGFGGHGRSVADVAFDSGYEEVAFLDDSSDKAVPQLLGPFSFLEQLVQEWPDAIAAVGDNALRLRLFEEIGRHGFKQVSIIHPSAQISRHAQIGDGVFVGRLAVVGTNAKIGSATIVNTGATIDHDCRIGLANHIAPGATLSGEVETGERVWLGTGCSVRQRVRIGADSIVGVGAAVVADLAGAQTYMGVPAQALRR
ncbi:MAG: acetyltransferase [Mesorhizobium sp.]